MLFKVNPEYFPLNWMVVLNDSFRINLWEVEIGNDSQGDNIKTLNIFNGGSLVKYKVP